MFVVQNYTLVDGLSADGKCWQSLNKVVSIKNFTGFIEWHSNHRNNNISSTHKKKHEQTATRNSLTLHFKMHRYRNIYTHYLVIHSHCSASDQLYMLHIQFARHFINGLHRWTDCTTFHASDMPNNCVCVRIKIAAANKRNEWSINFQTVFLQW